MSKPFYHLQGLNCRDGIDCTQLEAPLWRACFVAREVILICPEGMSADEQEIYFNALIKYMVSTYVSLRCYILTGKVESGDGDRQVFGWNECIPDPIRLCSNFQDVQRKYCAEGGSDEGAISFHVRSTDGKASRLSRRYRNFPIKAGSLFAEHSACRVWQPVLGGER